MSLNDPLHLYVVGILSMIHLLTIQCQINLNKGLTTLNRSLDYFDNQASFWLVNIAQALNLIHHATLIKPFILSPEPVCSLMPNQNQPCKHTRLDPRPLLPSVKASSVTHRARAVWWCLHAEREAGKSGWSAECALRGSNWYWSTILIFRRS